MHDSSYKKPYETSASRWHKADYFKHQQMGHGWHLPKLKEVEKSQAEIGIKLKSQTSEALLLIINTSQTICPSLLFELWKLTVTSPGSLASRYPRSSTRSAISCRDDVYNHGCRIMSLWGIIILQFAEPQSLHGFVKFNLFEKVLHTLLKKPRIS